MPRKDIAAWKRKKAEVEARIEKLEAIKQQTREWLAKASTSASKSRETFLKRDVYWRLLEFSTEKAARIIPETAQKLDAARKELLEINERINELENRRTYLPLVVALAVVMALAGGLFLGPSILNMLSWQDVQSSLVTGAAIGAPEAAEGDIGLPTANATDITNATNATNVSDIVTGTPPANLSEALPGAVPEAVPVPVPEAIPIETTPINASAIEEDSGPALPTSLDRLPARAREGKDTVTTPSAPAKKQKKSKTLDEIINETRLTRYAHDKERIKEIKQLSHSSEEIMFNDKSEKTLVIHQPLFDGMHFGDAVRLAEKDDFTYTTTFGGTTLEVAFDSPEIKSDKLGKRFGKSKKNSTDEWKMAYTFALPSEDFAPRFRISSSSAITVMDESIGAMASGEFVLDFKAEKLAGYEVLVDQVNAQIVYVYLARNYTAEGIAANSDIVIDPTLTISNTATTLCGDVTAYDVIDVNTGGVLDICEGSASQYGAVNISLGYNGQFTLDSTSRIEGQGAGGVGGIGNTTSGGTGYQGQNGQNGTVGGAFVGANRGGGGGGTKVAGTDSAAGCGGGFGGNGGKGGLSASGTACIVGVTYSTFNNLTLQEGSGGSGGAGDNAYTGGDGGGGIKIVTGAAGLVQIAGIVNVSGNNGTNSALGTQDLGGAGGGSGGHVVIIAGNLQLAGITMLAKGGGGGSASGTDSCPGGGGGGGRIYIVYDTLVSNGTIYYPEQGLAGGNLTGADAACNNPSDALGPSHGANGTFQMNGTYFDRMVKINLTAPADSITNTTNNTPSFYFNVSDDLITQTFLNCTLWLQNSTGAEAHGTNNTVFNSTVSKNTSIMSNSTLNNGVYTWWINCSDGIDSMDSRIARSNISEVRTLTINIPDPIVHTPDLDLNATNISVVGKLTGTGSGTQGFMMQWVNVSNTMLFNITMNSTNGSSQDASWNVTNVSLMFVLNGDELVKGNFTGTNSTVAPENLDGIGLRGPKYWNISVDTSTMPDGVYNILVLMNNWTTPVTVAAGQNPRTNLTIAVNVTVDNSPPNVTIAVSNNTGQNLTLVPGYNPEGNMVGFNITVSDASFYYLHPAGQANGTQVANVTFSFDNTSGSPNGGIGFNITVGQGGASNGQGNMTPTNSTNAIWNVSVNLSGLHAGEHTVRIFTYNWNGRLNSSVTTNFTLNTPHNVTYMSSPTGEVVTQFANYSARHTYLMFNISVINATTKTSGFPNAPIFAVIAMFDNASGIDFNLSNGSNRVSDLNIAGVGYWNLSYFVNNLTEGNNTVSFFVNDTLGNHNKTTYVSFTVDKTAPNVSNLYLNVSNGTNFTRSGVIQINATVNDTYTMVQNVTFEIINRINATQFNVSANKLQGSYTIDLDLALRGDGVYDVRVYANDTLNNVNTTLQNVSFTVDGTAPNVSMFFMNVSNETVYSNSGVIMFNTTLNDTTTTVQTVLFGFTNDANSSEFNVTTTKQGPFWYSVVSLAALTDGNYRVRVYGNDSLNNLNYTVANVSFTIITAEPTLHTADADLNATNISIVGKAQNGANNPGLNIQWFNVSGTMFFNITMNSTNGSSQDASWNVTNVSIMFRHGQNQSIMGNFTGTNSTVAPANGLGIRGPKYWNISVDTSTMPDGVYNILVLMNNWTAPTQVAAGQNPRTNLTIAVNVTVDNSPPNVSIASSNNNSGQNLTLTPAYNVEGNMVGFNITANDPSFYYLHASANNGTNLANITFSFDNTSGSPNGGIGFNITVGRGGAGFGVAGGSAQGNMTQINSTTAIFNVSVNLSALHAGEHTIRIFAYNFNGKLNNSATLNFTLNTPHNVTYMSSPTGEVVTQFANYSARHTYLMFNISVINASTATSGFPNAPIFAVIAMFDNASGIDFNLSNGSNRVSDLNIAGVGYWNLSYFVNNLTEGNNTVSFFVNDTLGNHNKTTYVSFTVDKTAPNVSNLYLNVSNGTNFTRTGVIQINATVNDTYTMVQNVTFEIINRINATQFNVSANKLQGSYTIDLDLALRGDGVYDVRVYANDSVNNVNTTLQNASFTVDGTAPNVSMFFMNVSNGTTYDVGGVIMFNATLNDTTTTVQTVLLGFTNDANGSEFNISTTKQGSFWYATVGLSSLTGGNYTVRVYGNDSLNNLNWTVANVSFSITNKVPVISNITNTSPVTITEGGSVEAFFSFVVFDPEGFGDVDNTTARLRVNITTAGVDSGVTTGGFADRTNSTCATANAAGGFVGRLNETALRYNCSVYMWYWDTSGNWTVNASIKATNGVMVQDYTSKIFELYETASMVMSPNALTWATLDLGDLNKTSNADPIVINNTGNKNISAGGITVTGYDLQGLTINTEFIKAQNFSIRGFNGTTDCTGVACLECNGTLLLNATAGAANPQGIDSANMTRGNNSIAAGKNFYYNESSIESGQEALYVCLRTVPSEISRQLYDTSGTSTSSWIVGIS